MRDIACKHEIISVGLGFVQDKVSKMKSKSYAMKSFMTVKGFKAMIKTNMLMVFSVTIKDISNAKKILKLNI